jgi:hypothetical protein
MALEITPAQARYIADYLEQEFGFSFQGNFELEGGQAIEDAVKIINGGAMEGFEEEEDEWL